MYVRAVPRVVTTIRTALKELDWPCPADEIEGPFMRRVAVVLGGSPPPCLGSIARVASAIAHSNADRTIPRGYGGACVRHFIRRSEQLETILRVSIESRFALIELTSLASIAGQWTEWRQPRVSVASHRECLSDVVQLANEPCLERERWRAVVAVLLDSPSSSAIVLRNVAQALVWCGYFSPDRSATDEQLAMQVFREDRATFVRSRLEALRWLPKLVEISLLPAAGGAP